MRLFTIKALLIVLVAVGAGIIYALLIPLVDWMDHRKPTTTQIQSAPFNPDQYLADNPPTISDMDAEVLAQVIRENAQAGRYQLAVVNNELYRLDTGTGRTWKFQQVNVQNGKGAPLRPAMGWVKVPGDFWEDAKRAADLARTDAVNASHK